ncbi:DUF305 domain-containing protein [Streptomyces sp. NEAU-NA10]|uniref:DUF305 domain-containing protein n=1 Tax=Streptomyces sp. NEAU-NA10 TaxID=3416050 RepID=UPI003CC527A0
MRNTRTLTRRAAVVAASVTAALVLAACGNDSDDSGTGHAGGHSSASSSASADATAGAHNTQDVSFAQGMIPHHRQALEMAELAADRASSPQVKDLAARIEKAQDPEIKTMSGWLTAWGEDVPAPSGSAAESMPGMDHSGGSGMPGMPGMMDGSDMAKLEKASGTDFDTMFLTMMIEHHQGAVDMATTEKDKGEYGPATAMAGDIVTAQTAEITEMNKLLGKS